MKEYHKIQTVFLRDPATKYKTLLAGQFAWPEFEYLAANQWAFTEKVDGTNVRVMWDGAAGAVRFGGRTDNASMPVSLVDRLTGLFPADGLALVFPETISVCLYGEGYGARIQKGGGNYIASGVDFVLFDVNVDGIWLERHNVEDIASKLGIGVVPIVARGTLWDAVQMAQDGFQSRWGSFPAEGLVMRPVTELCSRMGQRIISKIKCKDFGA